MRSRWSLQQTRVNKKRALFHSRLEQLKRAYPDGIIRKIRHNGKIIIKVTIKDAHLRFVGR